MSARARPARPPAPPALRRAAVPADPSPRAGRPIGRSWSRQSVVGPLFVAPFLLLFVALFLVPLGYAAYLSVFRTRLIGGTAFVGLENYTTALSDPQLLSGVARVATFFVLQVPVMLVLALLFALALDSGLLRLAKVVRLGIFVPYAVPSVVAALMWGYLYGPDYGPFAQLSRMVQLPTPRGEAYLPSSGSSATGPAAR